MGSGAPGPGVQLRESVHQIEGGYASYEGGDTHTSSRGVDVRLKVVEVNVETSLLGAEHLDSVANINAL